MFNLQYRSSYLRCQMQKIVEKFTLKTQQKLAILQ